ncbi:hypothetical protein QLQ12_40710 [Actinoplanes sp. NEAU-A12]|uniref:Uncharacterized protein n=1 Tax=Actinoplanes sandaracinus TaxID=3045177 RepID=A0ABT6WYU3_9ACTN|nr:hypothetical protein [Actinoplanes sandaracinus]MDI6104927.1 hypothetical protein [Actinoplanes sandaracinus]
MRIVSSGAPFFETLVTLWPDPSGSALVMGGAQKDQYIAYASGS